MLAQRVTARGSRILISRPFSGSSRICAEQVSNQATSSVSSGQQRITFEAEPIQPLLEEEKAKQGGSLPDVEIVFDESRLRKNAAWKTQLKPSPFLYVRPKVFIDQYDVADAGNQIPEKDRFDIVGEQEQPIAPEDIEAEKMHRASIKMNGRRAFPSLRSDGNEGGANGRRAPRSFGRGNISVEAEGVRQGRSNGDANVRNRRGFNEGGGPRGDRSSQAYLRSREGGGQGRWENRRERERKRREEEDLDGMDETVGNDEFERLDSFFDKMMLGEFEQLQEALIRGPQEQVYERLDQRKFEQNILEPTPTIARELSKSRDGAVTAALLGLPSSQAPVRASPAAQRAILARQQRRIEKRGEYGRCLPTKVWSLGGIDFATLSGRAPVVGLQYLMAKKPEIGLRHREVTGTKIRVFLKSNAPELSAKNINHAEFREQPVIPPS